MLAAGVVVTQPSGLSADRRDGSVRRFIELRHTRRGELGLGRIAERRLKLGADVRLLDVEGAEHLQAQVATLVEKTKEEVSGADVSLLKPNRGFETQLDRPGEAIGGEAGDADSLGEPLRLLAGSLTKGRRRAQGVFERSLAHCRHRDPGLLDRLGELVVEVHVHLRHRSSLG